MTGLITSLYETAGKSTLQSQSLKGCRKPFEGVRSAPRAVKRKHIFNGLAARLDVVPFPYWL